MPKYNSTVMQYCLQPPPTIIQKKQTILEVLQDRKVVLFQEHAKQGSIYHVVDSYLDIMDTCLVLAHDYNLQGYMTIKKDCNGDGNCYCRDTLQWSLNISIEDFIGENTDFVCPSRELERIVKIDR